MEPGLGCRHFTVGSSLPNVCTKANLKRSAFYVEHKPYCDNHFSSGKCFFNLHISGGFYSLTHSVDPVFTIRTHFTFILLSAFPTAHARRVLQQCNRNACSEMPGNNLLSFGVHFSHWS